MGVVHDHVEDGGMSGQEFEPGRWWRVTYVDDGGQGKTRMWCETSNEAEAQRAYAALVGRESGVKFERQWVRHESEWRAR